MAIKHPITLIYLVSLAGLVGLTTFAAMMA